MASGVAAAIVAPTTALLIGLLSRAIARGRPKSDQADAGAIAPERLSAIFTVLVGTLFCLGGVFAVFAGGQQGLLFGTFAIAFGAVIGGFMAPSLTDLHIVRWSAEGVEGPSKTFGLTLGVKRTMIRWADIRRTGKTSTGYWFVESEDRRRIYWSYLYKGYGAFVKALAEHCPALTLPQGVA